MTNKQSKKVSELLSTIDIEVLAEDIKDIEDVDGLNEYLQDNGFYDVEIIYFVNAMDYLREHDISLQESLAIASEYGMAIDDLSSEKLASLLASQNIRDEFAELQSELEEILN